MREGGGGGGRREAHIRKVVGLGRKGEDKLRSIWDPHLDLRLPSRLVRHDLSLPWDILDDVEMARGAIVRSMREGGEEISEGQRVIGVSSNDGFNELACEEGA